MKNNLVELIVYVKCNKYKNFALSNVIFDKQHLVSQLIHLKKHINVGIKLYFEVWRSTPAKLALVIYQDIQILICDDLHKKVLLEFEMQTYYPLMQEWLQVRIKLDFLSYLLHFELEKVTEVTVGHLLGHCYESLIYQYSSYISDQSDFFSKLFKKYKIH